MTAPAIKDAMTRIPGTGYVSTRFAFPPNTAMFVSFPAAVCRGRLVTTRIVRKNTAAKHCRQKFAAAREFRQHGIILEGVRSDGPGPIVILAFRNDNAFPLRQVCKLSAEQLKSVVV